MVGQHRDFRHRGKCSIAMIGLAVLFGTGPSVAESAKGPLVFAAASMKTALDVIAAHYAQATGKTPVISYGSSGTLAKQIENGAPADVFISADDKWMSYLAGKSAIKPATRENLLGNELVLVEPKNANTHLKIEPDFDLAGALGDGKLAVCTVSSCPAGIYGKEALTKLNVYGAVEPKLAQADNVRAALLLVARGEAKFGIVYATDAEAEASVKVVDTFPAATHTPIIYPVAITTSSKNPDAATFEAFLRTPDAAAVLKQQGFTLLAK